MIIEQQIADVREWLDAATSRRVAEAGLDIRIMAIRARRAVDRIIHFKARSVGQKNRWKKIKSQEAV